MKKGFLYLAVAGIMSVTSASVFASTNTGIIEGPGDKKEKKKKKKKKKDGKSCSYKGKKSSCCAKSAKAESNEGAQKKTPAQ